MRSRVKTPLKSLLFQASIRICLNCVHNCEDHSLLDSTLLERLQIESARLVTGAMKGTNRMHLFGDIAWVELSDRRKMHKLCLMDKMVSELAPCYLCNLCPAFVNERSCLRLGIK